MTHSKTAGRLAAALVLTALGAGAGRADFSAIRNNPGFTTNVLARNDDGSTGLVGLGFSANFFGQTFTQAYVNNNGNITFDFPLSTFTPFPLTTTAQRIIAPFFADVDTRNLASDVVRYGTSTVDGRNAFGVNWLNVGFFASRANPLNSFQLVLVDRSDTGAGNFDIEFNYGSILWETGEASGGSPTGLGGSSARAGFSSGTGAPGSFFEIAGSAVNGAFLDGGPAGTRLAFNSLNSTVTGRFLFNVRNGGIIVDPGPGGPVVPAPAGVVLLGIGFAGLAGRKLARRKTA